jgi:hypothetical protein
LYRTIALQLIMKEIRDILALPSFEEWQSQNGQLHLFSPN